MPDYFQHLQNLLELNDQETLITVTVIFLAAVVRGFSGFALSALIMASLSLIIPPISLIPVCFVLEMVAGLLMIKNGVMQADKRIAWGLAAAGAIGTPVGLYITAHVPADVSRLLALSVILLLALMQLLKHSPPFLATRSGLYIAGLVSGIVSGVASVGGMAAALYVLSQKASAPRIRATLVMYLFLSMFVGSIWLALGGLLNALAITRALTLAPLTIAGVLLGSVFFRPSLESAYKRFCLVLLIALAAAGLLRVLLTP